MNMPAIVTYRARNGNAEQLSALLAGHWQLLHAQGYVTDQPAFLMRDPRDSEVFVEVFAWQDENGPEEAWRNPQVTDLWNEIQSRCQADIDPVYYETVTVTHVGGG
jgi:hypothetical protein